MDGPHLLRRAGSPAAAAALLALLPLAFLAVFFVLPLLGMLGRGFVTDGTLDLSGVGDVLGRSRTARVLAFTAGISTLATAVTLALGVPTAYVLHRLRVPGAGLLRALVVMPFVMPTVVVGVLWRGLLASSGPLGVLGLDGSWVAILLAMVFFNVAVVVRTVGAAWDGLDPRTAQAAAALGASPGHVLRTVTLPALRPAVVSAASVVFLFCSTAFGVVLTLGGLRYATVETEIYLLTTSLLDLQGAAVLSVLQLVVVVILLVLSERTRSRARGVRRRSRASVPRVPVARRHLPALVVAAVAVLLVLAPLVGGVVRSLRRGSTWTLANYAQLTSEVPGTGASAWHALGTSWRIAVDAALLALVLGLLVALAVTRRPRSRRGRSVLATLDATFMLPLGVSAVTIGFGFLITLDRPPLDLRSTPLLVPVAQAMVALPLVVRTIAPVLRDVDRRQGEAAATLGAGPLRAWATVELPVLWRPLLAAVGFALAVSLGEFGATAFLARPDEPTLPVLVYTLMGRPGAEAQGGAMAAAVLLAAVTVAVMGLVERLRLSSVGAF
ncbi:ABC transporter permease subunit [Janibacter melonis]|uniref:ABC transporter permease n=1 Tax=Janibacter melonis TaxID=262209 RepID=UPI0020449CCF|nr:ABC transporter permease subunit [Janibacter melonis]MCM3556277.1 ABC transporter permease subunit [Janibacter melonis]